MSRPGRLERPFTHLVDKIHGALAAAVIGDALGAPTEQRSIREIRTLFGFVTEFHRPPADSPYAKGREAAQFTDDSSQMLMLCDAFVAGDGEITARAVADMVVAWSALPEYFPHFAGPSTRRAIQALKDGADPETVGAEGREATMGATNGAAMRVSPAGMVHPGDIEAAVLSAATTCRPTHFTSLGVSAAAAIAAAVAIALRDDATVDDVVAAAIRGSELGWEYGATHGREVAGASVTRRIELAARLARESADLNEAIIKITEVIGTGLHASEAVPAAIGFFVAADGDPWKTVVAAANAGDDSDTVGAMAGAIAGALRGIGAIPQDKLRQVEAANNIDLRSVAERIAAVARPRAELPTGSR